MARRPRQDTKRELLNQQEVWEITHQTLSDYVRLDVSGDVYDKGDILDVVLHAASTAGTIERSCDTLSDGIGGGNGIRYHLNTLSLGELETDVNEGLVAHLPKRLFKRARRVAVDLVLVPYYGRVDAEDEDGDDRRFGQKFTQMLGAGSFPASAEAVFELAAPEVLHAPAPIRTDLLALRRRNAPPPSSHRGVSQSSCEPS